MEPLNDMACLSQLRVVIAHDWLTGMRGGEKVLEVFCRRWPRAALFTLLHKKNSVAPVIEALAPRTSFLQKLPGIHRYYRYLLPLMPLAVRRWRLPACDLVLSSSHCVAKGVTAPAGVPHVCYCYTPMRYAWHMQGAYFHQRGLKAWLVDKLLSRLRDWDRRTAAGVTHFVAISQTVRQRIADCYQRDSTVIYPPVDTDYYFPSHEPRADYYLLFSAFAPYKRLDIAIEACNLLKRKLIVIGTGQDEKKLKRLAGATVRFLGWQPDEAIRAHMRRCRALLFPGEEDFGIVPVEAMACAAPVIAYARGGATETVIPANAATRVSPTGLWFEDQDAACLADTITEFERRGGDFDPALLRRQALKFSYAHFEAAIFRFLFDVTMGRKLTRAA
jgi:glycosyltransferase involved in cell wall biosynthesis